MSEEKTFPLNPGTTGIDVSDIEVIIVPYDEQPPAFEIRARKISDGTQVILCPYKCSKAQHLLETDGAGVTLEQVNDGYQIVIDGISGAKSASNVLCPYKCSISGLL